MALSAFLNLDFVRMTAPSGAAYTSEAAKLDAVLTYSRATTAMRWGSNGYLATVAAGRPRFDYDPVTLAVRGLLIEGSTVNYALQSSTFEATNWAKFDALVGTHGALYGTGPNGSTSWRYLQDTAVNAGHYVAQAITIPGAGRYTFSVYAKASDLSRLELWMDDNGTIAGAAFDLAAGTATTGESVPAALAHRITPVGHSVYRCEVTVDVVTNLTVFLALRDASASYIYAGTGAGVYVWGAQVEQADRASSPIATTTAQITRAADTLSLGTLTPWYNAAEGTCDADAIVASGVEATILGGTSTTRHLLRVLADGSGVALFHAGGADVAVFSAAPDWAGLPRRIAASYQLDGYSFAYAGGAVQTDASGTVPVPTSFTVGRDYSSAKYLNGHLRRLSYKPFKVSDLLLKAMAT